MRTDRENKILAKPEEKETVTIKWNVLNCLLFTSKEKYYHQKHVERWEKRYNKSYPHPNIGQFDGVRIIES